MTTVFRCSAQSGGVSYSEADLSTSFPKDAACMVTPSDLEYVPKWLDFGVEMCQAKIDSGGCSL